MANGVAIIISHQSMTQRNRKTVKSVENPHDARHGALGEDEADDDGGLPL